MRSEEKDTEIFFGSFISLVFISQYPRYFKKGRVNNLQLYNFFPTRMVRDVWEAIWS